MKKAIRHLKGLFVIIFILTAALLPLSVSAQTVVPCDGSGVEDVEVISVTHNTSSVDIKITCVSHVGTTWTYKVEEFSIPPDLSYWFLGISTCVNPTSHIISSNPPGAQIGKNGQTGFYGIKWNTVDSFTSGTFSFTLDKNYSASLIPIVVLTKAGPTTGQGNITGPDCSTTAIELASFSAVREGSTVSLQWETAVEIDNAGFNLYRTTGSGAPLVKVNEQLIAATGSGSSYSFSDEAGSGNDYYVLEDIDTSGVATRHSSFARAAQFRGFIFLPLIGDRGE